ncbi:MAG: hypothetical protein BWY90_01387 [Deltaproteobacteria bacterium ADurb.BinA014]|nr:MAG: hypothetical protein BWY90_01387 [Deltaproteobacteria bacterium ADurb.BinA014]
MFQIKKDNDRENESKPWYDQHKKRAQEAAAKPRVNSGQPGEVCVDFRGVSFNGKNIFLFPQQAKNTLRAEFLVQSCDFQAMFFVEVSA